MNKPVVLCIAGSDCSAGAGLQADLRTLQQLGTHATTAVTAITAQNSQGVSNIDWVAADLLQDQLLAVSQQFVPRAIKIGMLGGVAAMQKLQTFLQHKQCPVILDPVLLASSGSALFPQDGKDHVRQLIALFPVVDLLTPNKQEAAVLAKHPIANYQDVIVAANKLLAKGVKSVLIKGGHCDDACLSQDYWSDGVTAFWLVSRRHVALNYRGTGCVLSSAIAAALALGYDLKDALVIGKMVVNQGMRLADLLPKDEKSALLANTSWPEDEVDLPVVSDHPLLQWPATAFPNCGDTPLGLYPIVDSLDWVKKLLASGVRIMQLRIKHQAAAVLEHEIAESIHLAKQMNVRLFINDYWELAVKWGAYGVHLGQTDLQQLSLANIQQIQRAGLRLGISTHCYYEVARAHYYQPSYLACGPIYNTTSKVMPFAPQGIAQLQRWRRTLQSYPLVAIGGINLENLKDVWESGVDGVAMISAITQAPHPLQKIQDFLQRLQGTGYRTVTAQA